ncbi:hypothetical protein [Streptomyces lydicus]
MGTAGGHGPVRYTVAAYLHLAERACTGTVGRPARRSRCVRLPRRLVR